MGKQKVSIFWFRRDLRLEDNRGLYHALKSDYPVLPVFIFDKNILNDLSDKSDARVSFIHQELTEINSELKSKGTRLQTFYTKPEKAFKNLLEEYDIQQVHTNRDYEPYATERDLQIKELLNDGANFVTHKDQVIFEPTEVLKDNGTPYLVYTPYSKKWLSKVTEKDFELYTSGLQFENWVATDFKEIISLKEMGFEQTNIELPGKELRQETIEQYTEGRNFPAKDSTSHLGIHYRFGTVSIRKMASKAAKSQENTYLKELIWREFFMCIIYHFPRVVENNYSQKYDGVRWRNNEKEFEKWKTGQTGYPLVDAGMRELNQTGFMHNRVRMLVASFLTKHLLIDWKWGEAYFAEKLLDYELSSNNGNWQWSAGTGVDAQPYFRVFNPTTQIDKFDKGRIYIRKWIPEFETDRYPEEMVEHKMARERAIAEFKRGVSS
ncbi:DNA photolyase family protein [Vicingaceae bacterium]|nr:DNA photolyase family protein [Vicingaceae bacterium]MDB4061295.1 DNA photolyase family protein [Vicingaceae bacterium]MDB4083153.1 DNA photolyase family protein [Vicingaceae bacterium]MDC1451909.1 DNA photolyase family protein [Vicingaceae bacterium]